MSQPARIHSLNYVKEKKIATMWIAPYIFFHIFNFQTPSLRPGVPLREQQW